ncbi:hypothetical protein HGRIS_007532 [Hohenbuehelia grisea]|uniref:Uncharacterized protein n=1 Tax=Hohenbuehelia grisea TaxID=104357 RepID=A0ABR3J545_9AGAR
MSFSSDRRAVSASYVLDRLVQTLVLNFTASSTTPGATDSHTANTNHAYGASINPINTDGFQESAGLARHRQAAHQGETKPDGPKPSNQSTAFSSSTTRMNPLGRLLGQTADPYLPGPPPEDSAVLDEPPEPDFLARKIQALIDSLPPVHPPDGKQVIKPPKPVPPTRDEDGRPVPPPGSTPIKDEKLIQFLSSSKVMNGDAEGSRQSVWSVLQKMHHTRSGGPSAGDGGKKRDQEEDPSIMLYAPLVPTKDSKVEVAASVMVPLAPAFAESEVRRKRMSLKTAGWWPWKPKKPKTDPGAGEKPTERVWIPSTTKLSVQVMWWGYKLWLPPPVLDILNNKQIEATKRAAMLATALTWVVTNIPISMVPLPLQPALLILQRIVPYVGHVALDSSFVCSMAHAYWNAGRGVILTATWILPVALIPGTWEIDSAPTEPPAGADPVPTAPPPATPTPDQGGEPTTSPSEPTPAIPVTGTANTKAAKFQKTKVK